MYILWSRETKQFIFLDWRQDFGGCLKTGNIYYDLAKLMHGLIVSHKLISEGDYAVKWDNGNISFVFPRIEILANCEEILNQWCIVNRYDVKKVEVVTALIFLNIAALHHYP